MTARYFSGSVKLIYICTLDYSFERAEIIIFIIKFDLPILSSPSFLKTEHIHYFQYPATCVTCMFLCQWPIGFLLWKGGWA